MYIFLSIFKKVLKNIKEYLIEVLWINFISWQKKLRKKKRKTTCKIEKKTVRVLILLHQKTILKYIYLFIIFIIIVSYTLT